MSEEEGGLGPVRGTGAAWSSPAVTFPTGDPLSPVEALEHKHTPAGAASVRSHMVRLSHVTV